MTKLIDTRASDLNRRDFLGAAAAFTLALTINPDRLGFLSEAAADAPASPTVWLTIATDGMITIVSPAAEMGLVSRVTPVQTALRNCTRDEGRSFEFGNQVLISSHRKLLRPKAMVVNDAAGGLRRRTRCGLVESEASLSARVE
jgi:hypothetical protein